MAIYLKFADKNLAGDVTAENHKGWIEVHSLQWGVGRGVSMITGSAQERESSTASVSEVTFTKPMDKSSPALFVESCVGKGQKVEIQCVQTGGKNPESFLEYDLTDTMITGYSVSAAGDRPSESVSLSFTKIDMRYFPFDDNNTRGAVIPVHYDIKTGKSSKK